MPDRGSLTIGNCHSEEPQATWEYLLNCHSEEQAKTATWESRGSGMHLPNNHGAPKEILTSDVPSSSE